MGKKNYPSGWTQTVKMNIATLFSLYNSMGNVTISGATEWATTLDGPMKVFRAGALTVNAALTFSNRCRGVVPLLESLTMGASGSISMTGRGASGHSKLVNQDIVVPSYITLSGRNTSLQEFFAWIRANNYFLLDPNLWANPLPGMGDVTADYTSWPARGTVIIDASGCGAGAARLTTASAANGNAGAAGALAPGGGGGGASGNSTYPTSSGAGGSGKIWGGGPGSGSNGGGTSSSSLDADTYGGPGSDAGGNTALNLGGGAGNPAGAGVGTGNSGGTGTGGVLIIVCRGSATVTAGHALSANGVAGGNASDRGGGGSGGGRVVLLYASITGTPTMTATGGAGGTGSAAGGAGGAGATTAATLASFGL